MLAVVYVLNSFEPLQTILIKAVKVIDFLGARPGAAHHSTAQAEGLLKFAM